MQTETLYELLQDYKDPNGSVAKGVRKTEHQWMARFANALTSSSSHPPKDSTLSTNRWLIDNVESFGGWEEEDVKAFAISLFATKNVVRATIMAKRLW